MNRTVHLLDTLPFVYQPGRGVKDAVATLLNLVHCHIEKAKTHTRVLYLNLSSAFNTLQNISKFKLESDLALWVFEFLVGRPQQVRVNNTLSSVKVVSTGTPQGCVLSPLLYNLYINDCMITHPNIFLIKCSDHTAIFSLLFNEGTGHGPVVEDFVD